MLCRPVGRTCKTMKISNRPQFCFSALNFCGHPLKRAQPVCNLLEPWPLFRVLRPAPLHEIYVSGHSGVIAWHVAHLLSWRDLRPQTLLHRSYNLQYNDINRKNNK